MYTLQKASFLKRISAALIDVILIAIIATGVSALISWLTNYDEISIELETYQSQYEDKYGVSFDIEEEEYNAFNEEDKANFDKAYNEFSNDENVLSSYNMIINLSLIMVTLGCLFGVLITEFIIPIIFNNGQTVGKKCFNLCVVKNNCVRVTNFAMFVRSLLGKFTIELMIPLYVLILILFGNGALVGVIVVIILFIVQLILLFTTENKTFLHDVMSYTVVADKSSQIIFDTEEELIKAKEEAAKAEVKKKLY